MYNVAVAVFCPEYLEWLVGFYAFSAAYPVYTTVSVHYTCII